MGIVELFNAIFTNPIINLLVVFFQALTSIGLPYALGFSIIFLTIFIRILLYPFVSAQIRSAHKMQKVAPHISKVKEMYKNDKKKQQEEMMKLWKEHGINPAAGCLPLLIQLPVIWGLYHVLITIVGTNSIEALEKINDVLYSPALRINSVWNTSFFGIPLAESPGGLIGSMPFIILVPVLTGVFQFVLSKMMMPEEVIQAEMAIAKETKTKSDDFQTAFQKQALFIFPVMIGFFSYTFPIGLSLYWNTFTLFGILQQYLLVGPGGTKSWVEKARRRK